ncbi:NfeD family protein [Desulfosporosinus sp. OT]|uniref:NfeD family protein n=1 Tax=Desulfosporosinus sp. OT TaxID=913865 RepID=UPI0002239F9E|nr:NfeD family protein [Desulfosporosinus sp. OT]EGW40022.1 nfeD-like family protein [Desulfosporosinus sp. OT]
MGTGLIVALFVSGIVLLILEIFVPGGILGLFGIIALIAGIMQTVDTLAQGVLCVTLLLIALAGFFALCFRMIQTCRMWERITLKTCQTQKEGYVLPKKSLAIFLGKQGITLSQLRPSGTADFCGERLDVVTEGTFVTSGSRIKVIAVEGTRVIVRQVKPEHHDESDSYLESISG